jgi:protein-S-isoprenylcysteine O-methyltransferase Ste14
VLASRLDGRMGGPLPAALRPVGAALAVAGGALALWCIALFVTAGHGTPAPFDAPRRFVAVGPYRWVRNPMYLGGVALLGGGAAWLRSPGMVLLAAGGLGLAHLFVLAYEEPSLTRAFGDSYREYRRQVNRWIPRRPATPNGRGGAATR